MQARDTNILDRLVLSVAVAGTLVLMASASQAQSLALANALQGSGKVSATKPHRYADVIVEGDAASATYSFAPLPGDVGKTANLYVVARITEGTTVKSYALAGGKWLPWNGDPQTLPSNGTSVLQGSQTLTLLSAQTLFAGDYSIHVGYQVSGGPLVYSQTPLRFSVAATDSDALQRFVSPEAMEAYLKEGLQKGANSFYSPLVATTRGLDIFTTAAAAATGAGAESRTSATNLQESGVDEADSIKVVGNNLFMLTGCATGACLEVQRLDSAGAKAELLTSFKLDTKQAPDGMYFVDDGILGQDMLVTVSGQNTYWPWFSIWGGWQDAKTELSFLNASYPASISSIEKLTLDGALVSSRIVGSTLYVVTRYTPAIEGFFPVPLAKAEQDKNAQVLASTTLPQILPHVIDSRDKVTALVQSKDCYLPMSTVDGSRNPSIITITGVSLKDPTVFKSTCFLGASETLYMTPNSLYLATTSWDYQVRALDNIRYTPEHTTAIHKFALTGGGVDYRGSGSVKGHMGWHEDKKSFRMGENGAYLNIATSVGSSSNESQSTRLTVLKEVGNKTLQVVKTIDGIGKPGEQLYAARFLGSRAYLVTFRMTDPLYVVDLSSQENPRLVGELHIDGYSDYLHPISDSLLLGIGKDAVPATSGDLVGGRAGAWYQGVKVALFDVSNPAAPREINSRILGKRGTESEVLADHHAFSYLPPRGNEPARFAIPVTLHDKPGTSRTFDPSSPRTWYDYTHTALYSFEASAKGLTQTGRIIAETAEQRASAAPGGGTATTARIGIGMIAPIYASYGDRSVLKDNAVFYVHNGKILGSLWGENK